MAWPPRSPDITPLDFYLWGYVKQHVCSERINDINRLKQRITDFTPDVLTRVREELDYRLDYVNSDKDIMTSKLFTIDELIDYKLSGSNLSDDEEVTPPFFKDAMDSIEELRIHFFCQKNGGKIHSMNLIRFIMMYLILTENQHVKRRIKIFLSKRLLTST
ncbi:hypothetical protein AVEN_272845-1 [Araneus ventricosus]|uniref:Uncharacterized protein n=1 Tax=Araneus ventricosus TaxID=182803 RepID=A0A4Y2JT93_ARAVE|nr:hypothetical protein AVEN_272845-1 [Araneus ventricosus]